MAIKKYLLLGNLQETTPLSRDSQFTHSKTLKGLLIGGGGAYNEKSLKGNSRNKIQKRFFFLCFFCENNLFLPFHEKGKVLTTTKNETFVFFQSHKFVPTLIALRHRNVYGLVTSALLDFKTKMDLLWTFFTCFLLLNFLNLKPTRLTNKNILFLPSVLF